MPSTPLADRKERLLALLEAIETEMKRIGFWSHAPPDLRREIGEGGVQSYLEAPSFELWLQCVFIPNARSAAEADDLPLDSQVGEMARRQYDFHSRVPEAQPLLELPYRFDDLITARDLSQAQGQEAGGMNDAPAKKVAARLLALAVIWIGVWIAHEYLAIGPVVFTAVLVAGFFGYIGWALYRDRGATEFPDRVSLERAAMSPGLSPNVRERVREDFPPELRAAVEETLRCYGTRDYHGMVEQVRMAILTLSRGDQEALRRTAAYAVHDDWRDVLSALTPKEPRLMTLRRAGSAAWKRVLSRSPATPEVNATSPGSATDTDLGELVAVGPQRVRSSRGYEVAFTDRFQLQYREGDHVLACYVEPVAHGVAVELSSAERWEAPYHAEPIPPEKRQEIRARIEAALRQLRTEFVIE